MTVLQVLTYLISCLANFAKLLCGNLLGGQEGSRLGRGHEIYQNDILPGITSSLLHRFGSKNILSLGAHLYYGDSRTLVLSDAGLV